MSLLDRLFGRTEPKRQSIYDHIRSHLPPDGPGLIEGGETLPDESDQVGDLRWAPGALDGVSTHHMALGSEDQQVDDVVDLIQRAASASGKDVRELERRLRDAEALSIVDQLLQRLAASPPPIRGTEAVGRRLATTSGSRNAVKIGISLLGIISGPNNRDLFMVLGRHDEFTLFCAVALANTEADPERAMWELAQLVDGWGRIHLVERLKTTTRLEIRDWILRVGFRNSVMSEYLAYVAATTGGLVPALEASPDDEVLNSGCDILSALIVGGPAEDIDDYEDAPRAMELLLGHLEHRAATLHQFLAFGDFERFLGADDERWATREEQGWSPVLRERLRAMCREIKARPEWRNLALAGLASDDPGAFYEADRAARSLSIDTLDAHLHRLEADPLDADWFTVMEIVDVARVRHVLDLAQRTLPLTDIGRGPSDELGLGPGFRAHNALGFIVWGLNRFPGEGWPLIVAALRSPVVNNRNAALSALDAWDRSLWPADARAILHEAASVEPEEEVRQRMERLTQGDAAPVVTFDDES